VWCGQAGARADVGGSNWGVVVGLSHSANVAAVC
jgi:hypothetical protein